MFGWLEGGALRRLRAVDGSDNTAVGDFTGQNVINGFNNTYVGDFVGSEDPIGNPLPDESSTIRIGDLSNGNGSEACYIGGIFNNLQPVGGSVVVVTLDLADDHLGYDDSFGSAPAAPNRAIPQPRVRPQPGNHAAMLNQKVEQLQATVTRNKQRSRSNRNK
jgi:hypothetical protein